MKNRIILAIFFLLLININFVLADLININSGGSDTLCINNGYDSCFFSGDLNPPTINLITLDNIEDTDTWITLSYSVSSLWEINSCSLYLDNILTQTSTSITKDITQSFTVHNPPVKDSLAWFVSCIDFFSNIGNSVTYHIDTKLGGSGGPGGGGGGGTVDIEKKYGIIFKDLLCNLTYNSSLKNESKYTEIDNILKLYKNMTGNETSWTEIRTYIDYWDGICGNFTIEEIKQVTPPEIEEIDYSWVWFIIITGIIGLLVFLIIFKKYRILFLLGKKKKKGD